MNFDWINWRTGNAGFLIQRMSNKKTKSCSGLLFTSGNLTNKMADEETADRNDASCSLGNNIFEILQNQSKTDATKPQVSVRVEDKADTNGKSKKDPFLFRNLPGLHVSHAVDPVHVSSDNNSKLSSFDESSSSPENKRLHLTVSQQGANIPDPCVSPESNKRKRIQHDYRRLSNSGYLDDYVCREGRFSSTSESEAGVSPSPPKTKMKPSVNGASVVSPKGRYLCELSLALGDRWAGIILISLKTIIFQLNTIY